MVASVDDGARVRVTNRPLTVAALMLAVFMAALEVTVVSTAMPTVVGDLGGVELYAWVFTAYVLSSTVCVPIFGKLADVYGRKPILVGGIAVFLLASVACGQSHTMAWLIGFRAVQGVGGGAMQSMALTVVGDIFTLHERARMQGVIGAVWGVAGLVGPIVGGTIVNTIGWQWVFYVNVPFGLGSVVLLWHYLHEKVERMERPLDWRGALLLGAAVTFVLVGARGSRAAWALPSAALLAVLFVLVERRAPDPILPLTLFSKRVIAVASAAGTLIGGALMSTLTFVPLFVQGVLGGTPTQAGATIAPMAVAWPIASALGGRMIPRLGFRPLVRVGLLVNSVAAVAMAVLLVPGVGLTLPRVATALFGLGLGFANTALLIAVQTSVGWAERGVATASTLLFRTLGGALAVGVLGEVLAAKLREKPELAEKAAALLAGGPRGSSPGSELLSAVLFEGLATVFVAIAALSVGAFVLGLAFPREVPQAE